MHPLLAPTAGALFALTVYCLTLPQSVTGEDSGELITAAYTLGVPHPPGYPVWTVIAHIFTLLPVGSVAWRVNLMSAVFAAGTIFLLILLLQRLFRDWRPALAAGLMLIPCAELWQQATIAEVYTLNLFVLTACLLLLLEWEIRRTDRWLYALAVVYGLSLGIHNTPVLTGPLFALFILWVDPHIIRRLPFLMGLSILALLIAGMTFLYLPLASRQNPAMDWGDPESLQRFWDVITRKQYAFMFDQYPRSPGRFLGQLWDFLLTLQSAMPVAIVGFFGLFHLAIHRPRYASLLIAVGLVTALGFIYMQNPGQDREWRWVMSVFYLPAYLVSAIGLGSLVNWAFRKIHPAPVLFAVALLVLVPLAQNFAESNKREFYWASDYAQNLLIPLPKDAILVPQSDHSSFATTYLQAVEGVRPDVLIARKHGYLEPSLIQNMAATLRAEIPHFPRRRDEPQVIAWLLEHTKRPVFFTYYPSLPPGTEVELIPAGLLLQAVRPGEQAAGKDYWAEYFWHTLEPEDTHRDLTAQSILAEVYLAQAREKLAAGDPAEALPLVESALDIVGRDHIYLNNTGTLCARHGQLEMAEKYFTEAVQEHPDNAAALRNLERVRQKRL